MRARPFLLLALGLAACRTSNLGGCADDSTCPAGSYCDGSQSVCMVLQTGGAVVIETPAPGAKVSGPLVATAAVHLPGGASALRFELRSGQAFLSASASGDGVTWSAALQLGALNGPATLQAIATVGQQVLASAPLTVYVQADRTPPAIALQTDGRATLLGVGQTAVVNAAISDGAGSGVDPSSVALQIAGRAALAPSSSGAGVFTFDVLIDASIAPAGATTSVPFSITARDHAGNTATLGGDPAAVIRVDRDAPQIGAISLSPAPGFTDGAGRRYYGAGGPLTVTATITDSNLDPATVCLWIGSSCSAAGKAGAGSSFSFTLARPSAPSDGTTPLSFTLRAADALAAQLTGTSQAEHEAASAVQQVYFDDVPPAISIATDAAPHARALPDGGAAPIPVGVFISAADGIPDGGALLNNSVQASYRDGGFFSFPLDPSGAPAGAEGAYAFTISAADNLGNAADAGGTRLVDDAPPALSFRVFEGADPGTGGVTYPATVPNTGWTGSSFIYSDTVHVKGTLQDVSGVGSATVRIDGSAIDGGLSLGASRALGCAAAATSCDFDVQVALNDPQNGAFHTGMSDAGVNNVAVPSGALRITIDAQDDAVAAGGTPAPHRESAGVSATATRLLWMADAGTPAGLAVHPSGDVIVSSTTNAAVYDLNPDDGGIRWTFGAARTLGGVPDAPAIGGGSGGTAPIYVTSGNGGIYALGPDGGVLWARGTNSTFAVSPAVDNAAWSDGGTGEQALAADDNSGAPTLWAASAGAINSVTASDSDPFSPPIVLGSSVWFGNNSAVSRHALGATPGPASDFTTFGGPYFGLVTDGTLVFASEVGGPLFALSQTLSLKWPTGRQPWLTLNAEPTLDIQGNLVGSDTGTEEWTIVPSSGALAKLVAGGNSGLVPLQGSDGHWYLPRQVGFLLAYEGAQISWFFDPSGSVVPSAAMDCKGRLFVASGKLVFAFITDDHGLADTPWPNRRRDARNTGNASAPKYGIRTAQGCTQ